MKLLPLLTRKDGTYKSLATAESLTAGMVCATIAQESGISAALRGGICAYTLESKVKILEVNKAEAESCHCVSTRVAREMARGARLLFQSDFGIATTGFAEPYPEAGVVTPFAYWAICFGPYLKEFTSGGVRGEKTSTREEMRQKTTAAVLEALEALLKSFHTPPQP